jgi:hypothetical protein
MHLSGSTRKRLGSQSSSDSCRMYHYLGFGTYSVLSISMAIGH